MAAILFGTDFYPFDRSHPVV